MGGMSVSAGQPIAMRLVIEHPVAGVLHSLQDKASRPVDARQSADGSTLTFDFTIRIAPGPRFLGEQVRSEGPTRRFAYIAVGGQAGDAGCTWSRRMKIDIHTVPAAMLDAALAGAVLEGRFEGTGHDGTPACGTIRPVDWRAAAPAR